MAFHKNFLQQNLDLLNSPIEFSPEELDELEVSIPPAQLQKILSDSRFNHLIPVNKKLTEDHNTIFNPTSQRELLSEIQELETQAEDHPVDG